MKEDQDLLAAWTFAWSGLNAQPPVHEFNYIVSAYASRAGGYHDLAHLRHVIELASMHLSLFERPCESCLALFYHDVIYEPKRSDNEQRSADTAASAMRKAGTGSEPIARVCDLIMATRHEAVAEGHDARIVVDIDLSILGADEDAYRDYVRGVRKEYAHVPGFLFKRGRRALMQSFLERESIYQTETFRERFEEKARKNIDRELRGAFEQASFRGTR